jgi:hypothetical protein
MGMGLEKNRGDEFYGKSCSFSGSNPFGLVDLVLTPNPFDLAQIYFF